MTTLYLLKQSHTQKNCTCLISIIRSHLNQYIYSQVPVNANICFTSTALLHSDKCDRYACLNVFLLTRICQGWTSREMDISLSVRIPLVYIASVWIFPQVYQSVFVFFFPFFLLPICRALHLGHLLTNLHVKRKWQIRWFLLSIRKSSSCKETNHVISVGAISFLIYKLKMKLIDYCIDMDSLNDEQKITSTC